MCGQGEKLSEGDCGAPGGPREGAAHHPMWDGLCIRRRQSSPCTGINLIRYNTSNTPRSHNSATRDVDTGSKLGKHHGGKALREDVYEL
jgi:hypothetical protein